jgi:tetratricopeptide (TPR) repeat protein
MNTEIEMMHYIQTNGAALDVIEVTKTLYQWRREGHLERGLRCGEKALTYVPDNRNLLNCLAWIYYSENVKTVNEDTPIAECLKIFQNSRRFRLPDDLLLCPTEFDPYKTMAFALSLQVIKRDPDLCLQILATIPRTSLSNSPKNIEGKPYPPEMQTYFVRLTKAMEQTKGWSALWEIRDTAISALEGSTLQHWIVKRVVTTAIEIGDLDSAKKYATHRCIPQNDKTWLSLFAELSFLSGDIPKAIEFLKRSIAQNKDLSFAVNSLKTLSEWMFQVDTTISESLTLLELQVRQKNGWPIKSSLQARVDAITRPHSELLTEKQLKDWWGDQVQKASQQRQTGTVKSHLSNGFGGFIAVDGQDDLYFSTPRGSQDPLPPIGTKVSFIIVAGFDKKKNKASTRAEKVRKE